LALLGQLGALVPLDLALQGKQVLQAILALQVQWAGQEIRGLLDVWVQLVLSDLRASQE